MDVVIDFGNTTVKIGVIQKNSPMIVTRIENKSIDLNTFFANVNLPGVENICYLSVTEIEPEIMKFFDTCDASVIRFTHATPLPFKVLYNPPESLGLDRLAGVVGGRAIFPESNLLIIQAGTCITYDVYLKEKGYIGGAISPGLGIRNRAMNTFTYQLPLISTDFTDDAEVVSDNTTGSLRSGIFNGAIFEICGFIDRIEQLYGEVNVIVSGGDMINIVNRIKKNRIFANSNITLSGLSEIIKLNEQKSI
jgi:type III pantothenate kinase